MIINDSNNIWEIIAPNGFTIILKPSEAYDSVTDKVLTIKKPSQD